MNILILGGGITGLSAAFFASQKYPGAQITLLEKTDRLGGWIRTSKAQGLLFEQGPRTFLLNRSPHLLQLLSSLDLPILTSRPQKRYIYHNKRLRSLSSFLPSLLPHLLRSLFTSPSSPPDESIYDFAARRFSPKIAHTLFDPMTLGIYAGDIKKLSVRSCFPSFVEKRPFSLFASKGPKGLFTLKEGMETLIHRLTECLKVDFVLNCPVESISTNSVQAGGKIWHADKIFSALPLPFPSKSLYVVNLAFAGDVLSKKGYGYLVPTQEGSSLLGVVFDSSIFPEQNTCGETRLTAMVREEATDPLATALQALEQHLHIKQKPLYTSVFFAKNAIPQFEVGCGFRGAISVDGCIERGARIN